MTVAPTTPIPAATVILIRPAASAYEVLLLRRHRQSGFMADSYVFPGGKVDPGETVEQAAARELYEEAAVRLDGAPLVPWAHWITPSVEPRRFTAHFFLARLPHGQTAKHDERETTELLWTTPADAVAAHARGELKLPPPTMRNLEEMALLATPDALFTAAQSRSAAIVPVLPKFVQMAGELTLLLPWDAAYASAEGEGLPVAASHPFCQTPSRIVLREGRWWSK